MAHSFFKRANDTGSAAPPLSARYHALAWYSAHHAQRTWPSGRQRADRSGPVAFHARGTFAPVDPQHLRLLWRAAAQPPRSLVHSAHCSGKGRVAERGCCKANTQDAHATSTEVTEPRSPMCLNNRTLPFLYARCGCAFAFGRPVVRSRLTL